MPKQRDIPDHRIDMIKVISPFAKKNTLSLKKKYKIKGRTSVISEKLNTAFTHYRAIKNLDNKTPKTKQQKQYIQDIEETTKRLLDLFEKISLPVSIKLIRAYPTDPDRPVFGELKDRLLKDLKTLHVRALFANYETPKNKGGKPSNDDLKAFIWKLADIYEEHTKLKATIGYNDITESYQGKFLPFIVDVFNACNLETNIKDLGKFTRRLLTKRNKTPK